MGNKDAKHIFVESLTFSKAAAVSERLLEPDGKRSAVVVGPTRLLAGDDIVRRSLPGLRLHGGPLRLWSRHSGALHWSRLAELEAVRKAWRRRRTRQAASTVDLIAERSHSMESVNRQRLKTQSNANSGSLQLITGS